MAALAGTAALLLALSLCAAPALAARASGTPGPRRPPPPAPDPASGWSFGEDNGREARWSRGISGAALRHRAVVREAAAMTASPDAAGQASHANPAGQAGHAAGRGRARVAQASPPGEELSPVVLSWERDTATWHPEASARIRQAGEVFSLHERHIVRAQARVGDRNASLSIGPEVILRDDNDRAIARDPHSPESAVGIGMRFRIGF